MHFKESVMSGNPKSLKKFLELRKVLTTSRKFVEISGKVGVVPGDSENTMRVSNPSGRSEGLSKVTRTSIQVSKTSEKKFKNFEEDF